MRAIEFQDSCSRTQNLDKIQSRDLHKPADDIALSTIKQQLDDNQNKNEIRNSEEAKDKFVNKDKGEDKKQQEQKNKNMRKENSFKDSPQKRRPQTGFSLLDVDG